MPIPSNNIDCTVTISGPTAVALSGIGVSTADAIVPAFIFTLLIVLALATAVMGLRFSVLKLRKR